MIAGHGADLRDQLLADVLGNSLLVYLGGEVITALRGVFVERALEELQSLVDLTLELFLTEPENFGLFAHKYAYIYAYFRASKSARQHLNDEIKAKNSPQELNCYLEIGGK
jgi:hypothetical protein